MMQYVKLANGSSFEKLLSAIVCLIVSAVPFIQHCTFLCKRTACLLRGGVHVRQTLKRQRDILQLYSVELSFQKAKCLQ